MRITSKRVGDCIRIQGVKGSGVPGFTLESSNPFLQLTAMPGAGTTKHVNTGAMSQEPE